MPREQLPVSRLFQEMIMQGHIVPAEHMEEMRLPGEYVAVPSICTYGIPDVPVRIGVESGAKLDQRS